MPAFCSVIRCSMRAERDEVRFFRFPAALKNRGDYLNELSKQRRESWVRSLKRGPLSETQLKNGRICSRHFLSGAPAQLEDKNNPDWIPSQNMGYFKTDIRTQSSLERYNRSVKRSKCDTEVLPEANMAIEETEPVIVKTSELPETEISATVVNEESSSISVQTDLCLEDLCRLFEDLKYSNSRIYSLQSKLDGLDLNEESFKNNNTKTCYFTGFPKAEMLFILYSTINSYLSSHPNKALSTFQQLLLTLMKLRLNLPFKYLAYRFNISPTTASETFYKCIDILHDRLKKLVFWPEREALQKNIPACFKESFDNRVAVIIDCFEVFTETPSKLLNAARCWSNYKHHETVKFLIGITPQGTISYISEAWGGRTSDKFLTENCGFLNLLLPGDIVLADRGFLIQDSVEILGARLEIPAFTKGKSQLHPADIESTRNIATVRIHVERVIGFLKKKFHIFQGPVPMSMLSSMRDDLSVLDKIIVVCSALINLCPSQIPLN